MVIMLKSVTTVREALEQATITPNRTVKFGVNNTTPFGIEVAFGQIKSTVAGNGWIDDTGVFQFCSGASPGGLPNMFDPLAARNWRIIGQWGEMAVKIAGQDLSDTYPQLSGSEYYSEITWNIGAQLLEGKLELVVQQSIVIVEYKS